MFLCIKRILVGMMKRFLTTNFLIALSAWFILVVFLLVTNPTKIPVSLIVVPFGVLMVALWYSWSFICDQLFGQKQHQFGVVVRHFGHMLAIATTVCLALQSIGQLSVRDILAVLLVCILGFFYVHRMAGSKNRPT